MVQTMTNFFSIETLILFGIAFVIGLPRLTKGPTTADRAATFDVASTVIMCIVGAVSVIYGTNAYLDSTMSIAIIPFVSSVSISRSTGGGRVLSGTYKKRH